MAALRVRFGVALLVAATMLLSVAPAAGQDDDQPAPLPQPEAPDPLANEGASDELDPNTPDPEAPVPAEPAEGELPLCPEPEDASSSTTTTDPNAEPTCRPKPRGRYADQPPFVPDSVNHHELRRAEGRLAVARQELVEAVAKVKSLRLRIKRLRIEQNDLSLEMIDTITKLEETERRLRERALASFVNADTAFTDATFDHDEVLRYEAQQFIVSEIFTIDAETIEEYVSLQARLDVRAQGLYLRLKAVNNSLAAMLGAAEAAQAEVERQQFERDVWANMSARFVDGIVFPIAGPFDYPLLDSWGFPRAPGTIDEHWHEGIDIFAPEGTPLVAAEAGVVNSIGVGTLGGLKLWIDGESGTRWYYAHLSAFAEGLQDGMVVQPGDLVGYVGHSGNAVGTPDHLHMQIHPEGGRPINPYPMLAVAAERSLQIAQNDAERARQVVRTLQ